MSATVALVIRDPWERAAIDAKLVERGHAVIAVRTLADLLFYTTEPDHAPLGLILAAHEACAGRHRQLLSLLRLRNPSVPIVLLTSRASSVPAGPWNAVLQRRVDLGQVAARVDDLIALAPSASEVITQLS